MQFVLILKIPTVLCLRLYIHSPDAGSLDGLDSCRSAYSRYLRAGKGRLLLNQIKMSKKKE